jgi:porphobilinogen deaminase
MEAKVTNMTNNPEMSLAVRVDPNDMVRYVHELMTGPRSGVTEDTSLTRAAQLRWSALNRALGDVRINQWTTLKRRDQVQLPAALIAAAGVAKLTMAQDEIVFDIPTLLDATLQLCEPAGNA